jgi:hypothetical protein
MNKFVLGALALSAASSPCLAGTGSDDAWLGLDRDINALSTSLAPASSGASVSGFIKASYGNSSDIQIGGNDLGGFSLNNARLNFQGSVGDYSLFVALEGATGPTGGVAGTGGNVGVLDAIASVNVTDQIKGSMGQFRPAFLASSLRQEDNLLFISRTAQGEAWSFRDQGISASGNFDQLGWWIGAQNGNDGAGNDLVWDGRVTFTAMGTAPGTTEGAYGSTGAQNLTIGAAYYDDANVDKGTAWCADVYFSAGALSASAEIVDYDDGFSDFVNNPTTAFSPLGGQTPWDVSIGYMVVPDQWEAALRFEDFDDDDNTTAITAGVNWYRSGHAAKWQLNYSTSQSDLKANEVDLIQVALVTSI